MRSGLSFSWPEAKASLIFWTRAVSMSLSAFCKLANWRAAGLRSTAVLPLAALCEAGADPWRGAVVGETPVFLVVGVIFKTDSGIS